MKPEQIGTGSKKPRVRGRAQRSLDLIDAKYAAAKAAQPITGRGIGYKLFTAGLISSMKRSEMQRVYRLLKEAREHDIIPWEWIVDETRELEKRARLKRSAVLEPSARSTPCWAAISRIIEASFRISTSFRPAN